MKILLYILFILPIYLSGQFSVNTPTVVNSNPSIANQTASADLEKDGDVDIVESGVGGSIKIFRNNGGTFTMEQLGVGINFKGIEIGDLNNDLFPDIVSWSDNAIYVYYYQTPTSYSPSTLIAYSKTGYFGALVDLNNDGFPDLILTGVGNTQINKPIHIYKNNNGILQFENEIQLDPGDTETTFEVQSGYFNADSYIDLVVSSTEEFYSLRNNGDLTFSITKIITTGYSCFGFKTIDYNHDGNLDIIGSTLLSLSYQGVIVLFGDGDNNLSAPTTIYNDCNSVFVFPKILDINKDNLVDIVAGSYGPCNTINDFISVSFQKLDGSFYPPTQFELSLPTTGIYDLELFDNNNDGLLDVYLSNGVLYLNSTLSTDLNLRILSNPTSLCSGQTFNINFEASGLPLSSNVYSVQLSNAAGSFASPVNIGSSTTRSVSGSISCTIPPGTPNGSGYKMRVVSSSAYSITYANPTGFSINTTPLANVPTGITTFCGNAQNIQYTATSNAGNSYAWTLPSGASVDGISNSNSITLDFSGFSGGNLVLTETSPNGCSRINTRSLTSLPVPAPNAINGLTNVIINSTNVNYTVNANAGNTYAWTLPGNASLVSGAGTTSILLNFNAVISSNTLTLVETNPQGCSNSQSITILLDKATQSISGLVNNLIKTYGDANQTLPLTASSGLAVSLVSDNPSVVSVNNFTLAFLDVGTVTLTASQAGDSYYKAAPDLTATVTVNKAGLTITIDNQSKVYGDPDPVFTHSYYGFVNGENTSVLDVLPTIAPLSLDAGNQAITGSGATDNHYSFIFVDGIYSISKAPLSISANNLSRGFGASNPSFTFSYVGFKNNENASVLDVLPIATSTAVPTSIPGTYPISVSGGSDNNYSFTLSDGILTVVSAIGPSLSVLPEDTGMCYGATVQLDAQLDNMQYRWFLRGNQISILKQPSLDESGIYVLEVEDPLGNIGRDTCRVQENTEPLGGSFLITYQAGSDDIVIVYDVSNPKPDSLQWNWGGGFAEKVGTQYRVQFTAAGTYTIQQTNFLGYCSQSISDNITVIPGKIFPDAGSMYSLMNVNAAPNPTSGEINITTNLEIEDQIQISVFDIYGNEQYSITSTEPAKIHTTTIDMSNWAVGNYNVRIISGTDLRVVKIEKL